MRVARARESVELPARFLLVGATNPCPCGEAGRPGACRCGSAGQGSLPPAPVGPAARPVRPARRGGPAGGGQLLGGAAGRADGRRPRAGRWRRARWRPGGASGQRRLDAAGLDACAVPGEDAAGLLGRRRRLGSPLGPRARPGPRRRPHPRRPRRRAGPVLSAEHVALALALRQPLVTPTSGRGMTAAVTAEPTARDLPDVAWLVALASLPDVGPARLAALRGRASGPRGLRRARRGPARRRRRLRRPPCGRSDPTALVERWRSAAAAPSTSTRSGTRTAPPASPCSPRAGRGGPTPLADDPEPPAVLFARGDPTCSPGRGSPSSAPDAAAATAGTSPTGSAPSSPRPAWRSCRASPSASTAPPTAARSTPAAAPPVGVVGTGLDVVYPRGQPRASGTRWRRRASLLGEAPLGAAPSAGGSRPATGSSPRSPTSSWSSSRPSTAARMHTVDEARAPRPPGPGRARARHEPGLGGHQPAAARRRRAGVRRRRRPRRPRALAAARRRGRRAPPAGPTARRRRSSTPLGWTPATLDDLVARTGLGLGEVAAAARRGSSRRRAGRAQDGRWIERVLARRRHHPGGSPAHYGFAHGERGRLTMPWDGRGVRRLADLARRRRRSPPTGTTSTAFVAWAERLGLDGPGRGRPPRRPPLPRLPRRPGAGPRRTDRPQAVRRCGATSPGCVATA